LSLRLNMRPEPRRWSSNTKVPGPDGSAPILLSQRPGQSFTGERRNLPTPRFRRLHDDHSRHTPQPASRTVGKYDSGGCGTCAGGGSSFLLLPDLLPAPFIHERRSDRPHKKGRSLMATSMLKGAISEVRHQDVSPSASFLIITTAGGDCVQIDATADQCKAFVAAWLETRSAS